MLGEQIDVPHLTVRNLGLQRNGKWLFRGVNLEVPRGKFIAVVGPSGVGKSSLLGCLAGMLRWTEGDLTYCCQQQCLHGPADFQSRLGIIFQDLSLTRNASVLQNVLCGRLGRYSWWRTMLSFPRRDKEEAYGLLQDLGLDKYVYRWVAQVSGGEQQRTAIARALFQEPEVFLADEPVSNLDSYLTGRVLGILKNQAVKYQRSVICVLHSGELVERFADYVLSLSPGDPEGWHFRTITR
jgi:phosphonate transport system ATP-binding protein